MSRQFQCCCPRTGGESAMKEHYILDHAPRDRKPFTCSLCGFSAVSQGSVKEHEHFATHRSACTKQVTKQWQCITSNHPYDVVIGEDIKLDEGEEETKYIKIFNRKRKLVVEDQDDGKRCRVSLNRPDTMYERAVTFMLWRKPVPLSIWESCGSQGQDDPRYRHNGDDYKVQERSSLDESISAADVASAGECGNALHEDYFENADEDDTRYSSKHAMKNGPRRQNVGNKESRSGKHNMKESEEKSVAMVTGAMSKSNKRWKESFRKYNINTMQNACTFDPGICVPKKALKHQSVSNRAVHGDKGAKTFGSPDDYLQKANCRKYAIPIATGGNDAKMSAQGRPTKQVDSEGKHPKPRPDEREQGERSIKRLKQPMSRVKTFMSEVNEGTLGGTAHGQGLIGQVLEVLDRCMRYSLAASESPVASSAVRDLNENLAQLNWNLETVVPLLGLEVKAKDTDT